MSSNLKVNKRSKKSFSVTRFSGFDGSRVQITTARDHRKEISVSDIIWETPKKEQQAWFINEFGANVNLGNISPNSIISLECLRLGLRGDTFNNYI